jgi:hypothetical protein
MEETIREIRSLDLVAYLLMVGIKYIDPPRLSRDGVVWFSYQNTPEFLDACVRFYNDEAHVNPIAFNSQLRELHLLVKSIKKGVNRDE